MDIYNPPQQVPYLTAEGGQKIQLKIIEIGAWDMDASSSVNINHGLGVDYVNIIMVQAVIFDDSGANHWKVENMYNAADPELISAGVSLINDTYIRLMRRTGGLFDGVNYDDVGINRGYLLVGYFI
jgi:hypothetical protein